MNKKKLFCIILTAIATATVMLSYVRNDDKQVTDAFLKDENEQYVVVLSDSSDIL